jgi:hypothetical protein
MGARNEFRLLWPYIAYSIRKRILGFRRDERDADARKRKHRTSHAGAGRGGQVSLVRRGSSPPSCKRRWEGKLSLLRLPLLSWTALRDEPGRSIGSLLREGYAALSRPYDKMQILILNRCS